VSYLKAGATGGGVGGTGAAGAGAGVAGGVGSIIAGTVGAGVAAIPAFALGTTRVGVPRLLRGFNPHCTSSRSSSSTDGLRASTGPEDSHDDSDISASAPKAMGRMCRTFIFGNGQ